MKRLKLQKKNKIRIPRKLKKKIPKGMYCYVFTGKTSQHWLEETKQFVPSFKIKLCPFFFWNHLGYGDCKYLVQTSGEYNGDKHLDLCLNDQCKS